MRTLLALSVASSLLAVPAIVHAQPTDAPPPVQPQPAPVTPVAPLPPPESSPAPHAVETPAPAPAAPEATHPGWRHHERRRPWIGGLAYGSIGFMPGEFSALQGTLQQAGLLGAGYDSAPMALVYGGGLGGLIGPLWVGGKAFGMHAGTTPHGSADTSLTGVGGGGEIGYAVVATEDWLVVPFIGMGGFGYDLTVKSKGPLLPVFPNGEVPAFGEVSYSASVLTGEIGLRANRLILFGAAGFTVGAELGYMSSLTRDAWATTSAASSESAAIQGAYFRLLVGGGGFLFRDDSHKAQD
jgi:hypothetical protein